MKFKVLAALAALSFAQPASAAIITVTTSGALSSGFDQTGRFGVANTDLTGAAFSVVMTFDTTVGLLSLGGATEYNAGGIGFGGGTLSPGRAILTVNGVAADPVGLQESYLRVGADSATADALNRITGDHVSTEGEIIINTAFAPGPRLLDNWHTDCLAVGPCFGGFIFEKYNYDLFPGTATSYQYVDEGRFKIDSFDVAVSGAVPEPATWAMTILGFGLAGAALRRRRLEIA